MYVKGECRKFAYTQSQLHSSDVLTIFTPGDVRRFYRMFTLFGHTDTTDTLLANAVTSWTSFNTFAPKWTLHVDTSADTHHDINAIAVKIMFALHGLKHDNYITTLVYAPLALTFAKRSTTTAAAAWAYPYTCTTPASSGPGATGNQYTNTYTSYKVEGSLADELDSISVPKSRSIDYAATAASVPLCARPANQHAIASAISVKKNIPAAAPTIIPIKFPGPGNTDMCEGQCENDKAHNWHFCPWDAYSIDADFARELETEFLDLFDGRPIHVVGLVYRRSTVYRDWPDVPNALPALTLILKMTVATKDPSADFTHRFRYNAPERGNVTAACYAAFRRQPVERTRPDPITQPSVVEDEIAVKPELPMSRAVDPTPTTASVFIGTFPVDPTELSADSPALLPDATVQTGTIVALDQSAWHATHVCYPANRTEAACRAHLSPNAVGDLDYLVAPTNRGVVYGCVDQALATLLVPRLRLDSTWLDRATKQPLVAIRVNGTACTPLEVYMYLAHFLVDLEGIPPAARDLAHNVLTRAGYVLNSAVLVTLRTKLQRTTVTYVDAENVDSIGGATYTLGKDLLLTPTAWRLIPALNPAFTFDCVT